MGRGTSGAARVGLFCCWSGLSASRKKQINLPLITKVNAAMLQPDGELNLVNRADQLLENQTNRAQNYGRLPIMLRD